MVVKLLKPFEMFQDPKIYALISRNHAETGIADTFAPDLELYKALNHTKSFVLVSYCNAEGNPTGIISVFVNRHPHCDLICATVDTFYVVPERRRSDVGPKLYKMALRRSKLLGADRFMITAKDRSTLQKSLRNAYNLGKSCATRAKKMYTYKEHCYMRALSDR